MEPKSNGKCSCKRHTDEKTQREGDHMKRGRHWTDEATGPGMSATTKI